MQLLQTVIVIYRAILWTWFKLMDYLFQTLLSATWPFLITCLYYFLCHALVKNSENNPYFACLVPSLHAPVKSSLQHTMKCGVLLKWNLLFTTWMLMNISVTSTLHVPLFWTRKHNPGPVPWHNDTTCSLKRAYRQAERKQKKDKLQVSYEIMRNSLTMFQRQLRQRSANTSLNWLPETVRNLNFFIPPLTLC